MAKKTQAVQLQTEVANDEEWEKLLQRDGLIIVDVYSDWCGSCQGMAANLKKLKLEVGGDMMQLATAKCDNITPLARFRAKSEPTWMFISKGKMVNLMFGADAPKLTRLILEELKLEQLAVSGEKPREGREITELHEEEQVRYDAAESIRKAAADKEEAKRAKELRERRMAECENILEHLTHLGVILVLPNSRDKYAEALSDLISEAGLAIQQTEKIKLTEQMIEELTFFSDFKFGDRSVRDCVDGRIALALLIKRSAENLPGDIDDIVLQAVYGNSRRHPGDERSASFKLMTRNDEDDNEDDILIGVWAPQNKFCKAFGLKNLFPNVSGPFKLPEVELPPHYVIVGYDAFKSRDVMELSDKYPGQVMAYGFFTTDIPPAAQLISKTVKEFEERTIPTTYEEKIVVQLAKTNPECFMAFSELGPSYMSSDAVAGEIDCQYFFPPGYNTPVEEVAEVKKKSKKKSKSKPTAITSTQEETVSQATSDLHKEQSERDHGEEDTEENVTDDERAADGGVEDEDDAALGEDKATSPIDHND